MSKFTFIYEDDPMPFSEGTVSKKTVEFSTGSIMGVIEEFELFLRGCGYNLDGHYIDLVSPLNDTVKELDE